ncbi:MAG: gliding motility-associated C-terminal domain-containing protein [Bacteroidetes bacterium]|nr:gliding motility-associated C-terminal domain-containing protein [Bacteroidota bacterium]
MVKLDANGNKQWDRTLGGSGTEGLHSLQQTADGGYILGGESNSDTDIAGGKSENNRGPRYYGGQGDDYWVVKLDANGNKQWDKTLGGSGEDNLYSLQQTADGGYILGGGSSSDTDIAGGKSENSLGFSDYWVVKLGCETSPPRVNLGPDISLSCAEPDTLRTYYAPTLSYRWYTLAAGVEDPVPGAASHELEVLSPGTYIVEVENTCNLTSRDTVVVGPPAASPKPALGPDRPWCRWTDQNANDPAYPPAANNPVLTGPAGTGISYRWWRNGAELTSQTSRTLTLTEPGEYLLEVRNGCGNTARDTVTLTRYDDIQPFSLTSTSEPRLCPGETQTWVGPSGSFAYTWEWTRNPDFSQVIATTRQIALSQPGTYRLTAIDSCGNYYRDSVVITRQADPSTLSLNLPPLYDRCIQQGRPLQLPADLGLAYRWTSEDGSLLSEEPAYLPTQSGTLRLEISDRCGRSAQALLEVIDADESAIQRWGTAFSPNADGLHDTYPPASYLDGAYRLQVFNRWGQLVYAGSQPWRGTDGSTGNADAPEGTYVVHIQVPDCQGGTRELIRTLTVIR